MAQPLVEFFRELSDPTPSPRGSPYCATCRTTLKVCPTCERALPVVEFRRVRPPRSEVCKDCWRQAKGGFYAHMASRIAERELAAGRDPADHRGYQHYTRDPEDVLRDAGRRRRARLKDLPREPYTTDEIFERDQGVCWRCHEPVTRSDATIDHVIPIVRGGPDTPDNVRIAHPLCNSGRTWMDPSGITPMLRVEEPWKKAHLKRDGS